MQPLDGSVFEPDRFGRSRPLFIQIMYLSAWFAPAVPLILAGCASLGMRVIPAMLARVFVVISVAAGVILTLASGVFSLASTTQLLHGVMLTISVASSFAIWSGQDGEPCPSQKAKLGIASATIVALWSLLTVPMILVQARVITDGYPYCIAEHSENSPIEALHELRGFSFYTTATGYKSTSEWYFHGLMIVDYPDEQRIYNWSPRLWRFDLVERPDALIIPVREVCVPS